MDDTRIPEQLLYGELKVGWQRQGCPRLKYKDTMKHNLKWCNTNSHHLRCTTPCAELFKELNWVTFNKMHTLDKLSWFIRHLIIWPHHAHMRSIFKNIYEAVPRHLRSVSHNKLPSKGSPAKPKINWSPDMELTPRSNLEQFKTMYQKHSL